MAQTDRHTDRHTDMATPRPTRPIRAELVKNIYFLSFVHKFSKYFITLNSKANAVEAW